MGHREQLRARDVQSALDGVANERGTVKDLDARGFAMSCRRELQQSRTP